jgi:deoxyxylulose-5-phosphate synthase
MLRQAVSRISGPVAIRYPKSPEGRYKGGGLSASKRLQEGEDLTVVTYGWTVNTALDLGDMLHERGISAEIIKLDYINPIDYDSVVLSVIKTRNLLVLEECVEQGCVGERIAAHLTGGGIKPDSVILKNLGSGFVPQGNQNELRKMYGIDAESVCAAVMMGIKSGSRHEEIAQSIPTDYVFEDVPEGGEDEGAFDEVPEDAADGSVYKCVTEGIKDEQDAT